MAKKRNEKKGNAIVSKRKPNNSLKNKTVPDIKFISFLKKSWKIIAGLGVVLGIILSISPLHDLFLSPKEKYEKETFVQGDLKAPVFAQRFNLHQKDLPYTISTVPPLFIKTNIRSNEPIIRGILIKDYNKNGFAIVGISGYIFSCFRNDLDRGIDIFNPVFSGCGLDTHLILAVKNERMYVSAEFKDLQKEELIGSIEFNHWKLYKPNMLDFNNDDEKLEVKDKQNHIVFSIKYESYGIYISGYFIGPSSIIVLPNDPKKSKSKNPLCLTKLDPNWKQKALDEISVIQSIF